MRAMVFSAFGRALEDKEMPVPEPGPGQVRVRVLACGVCRTDLHIVDGELDEPKLPLIPGHQIVGEVEKLGEGVETQQLGARVGIPWLGSTCSACRFCATGKENLCERARFTGYQIDGGFAELAVADGAFCFGLDSGLESIHQAPLLCAGLIGYRALTMTGDARRLGIYGFGAAAHIVTQVAVHQGRQVLAFTRPGDSEGQRFATELGAVWAGGSDEIPTEPLDAAIIFAPAGELVPQALKCVEKGGVVVCGGIHMSDIPRMPYSILWGERVLRSVANLTRKDARDFLAIAPSVPVRTEVHRYALEDANRALEDLRHGRFRGAAVIVPDSSRAR